MEASLMADLIFGGSLDNENKAYKQISNQIKSSSFSPLKILGLEDIYPSIKKRKSNVLDGKPPTNTGKKKSNTAKQSTTGGKQPNNGVKKSKKQPNNSVKGKVPKEESSTVKEKSLFESIIPIQKQIRSSNEPIIKTSIERSISLDKQSILANQSTLHSKTLPLASIPTNTSSKKEPILDKSHSIFIPSTLRKPIQAPCLTLIDKYKPKKLDQLIGNSKAINLLLEWTKKRLEYDPSIKRACFIYGPIGCGKSTAARVIFESLGLSVRELNINSMAASESIVSQLCELVKRKPLSGREGIIVEDYDGMILVESKCKKAVSSRDYKSSDRIIWSESTNDSYSTELDNSNTDDPNLSSSSQIDASSDESQGENSSRGYSKIGPIVNLISRLGKKCPPLLFICSDKSGKGAREVESECNKIRFYPPFDSELSKLVYSISSREKLFMDSNLVAVITRESLGDIRKLLNILNLYSIQSINHIKNNDGGPVEWSEVQKRMDQNYKSIGFIRSNPAESFKDIFKTTEILLWGMEIPTTTTTINHKQDKQDKQEKQEPQLTIVGSSALMDSQSETIKEMIFENYNSIFDWQKSLTLADFESRSRIADDFSLVDSLSDYRDECPILDDVISFTCYRNGGKQAGYKKGLVKSQVNFPIQVKDRTKIKSKKEYIKSIYSKLWRYFQPDEVSIRLELFAYHIARDESRWKDIILGDGMSELEFQDCKDYEKWTIKYCKKS